MEGTIGRVADTARTGSFITRRSHLNFAWIHLALSTSMIYTFCYGQTRRISSQLLESPCHSGATMIWFSYMPVFSEVKNPRTLEGKITRSRRLLPYWWKFKGRQKISGSKWRFGLKSGSREICSFNKSSEALKSGLRISGSKRIYLSQSSNSQEKLKGPKRVCCKAQLQHMYPISRSFGGFLFKQRSYSNQREHSCRYPFHWHTAKPTRGFLIVSES